MWRRRLAQFHEYRMFAHFREHRNDVKLIEFLLMDDPLKVTRRTWGAWPRRAMKARISGREGTTEDLPEKRLHYSTKSRPNTPTQLLRLYGNTAGRRSKRLSANTPTDRCPISSLGLKTSSSAEFVKPPSAVERVTGVAAGVSFLTLQAVWLTGGPRLSASPSRTTSGSSFTGMSCTEVSFVTLEHPWIIDKIAKMNFKSLEFEQEKF